MQLFYTPDIQTDIYTLSAEESRHAVGVLRLKEGDPIHLIDGRGTLFIAEVITPSAKACTVHVVSRTKDHGARPYRLHIAIAPTKNIDRYEWFLEKATEIGIDRISPIICDRSERKVVKHDRSEKIILSAVKQSLKARLPQLDEQCTIREFLAQDFSDYDKYIAHCDTSVERLELNRVLSRGGRYVILIGAEGDFSPAEVVAAHTAGFRSVALGESRLRTETAGVAAALMAAVTNN